MDRDHPYAGLGPTELWRHFAALNQIPRRPKYEGSARQYIEEIAKTCNAEFLTDDYGNCIVRTLSKSDPMCIPIAIQSHLDMVCERTPDSEHNFDSDPIIPVINGDKVSARHTTLGADNGIGVAAALALLTDPAVSNMPLELIFTVEEEIGLLGAINLDVSLLTSRYLINLDSEEDDALTIGCAGEQDLTLAFDCEQSAIPVDWSCVSLQLTGLAGGHSGVQIHEPRGNAIKLMTEILLAARDAELSYRLVSFDGGSAHNAIPREANIILAIPTAELTDVSKFLQAAAGVVMDDWRDDEPEIEIELKSSPRKSQATSVEASGRLLALLSEIHHGVLAMSEIFPDTVETSANLAILKWQEGRINIVVSIRGFIDADVESVAAQIEQLAESRGASVLDISGYPGWEPRSESPLKDMAASSYARIHGRPPSIEVVHGGLECGVLVSRNPNLEAISFGPRIRQAHTPKEHVFASTVTTTWELLVLLLKELVDSSTALTESPEKRTAAL